MKKLLFFLFLIIICWQSCTTDQADPVPEDIQMCDTVQVTYTKDIASIINMNCAVSNPICHSRPTHFKNIFLETYDDVKTQAQMSRFLCAIKHENECTNMPLNGDKLPQEDITKIECWINSGFPQ